MSQNVRDIGNAFDVLANQAKLNKDAVLNAALKVECDKVWDALITQATDAQTDIDAQATKIDKSLSDKTLASVGATPIDDQRNTRRFNRSNIDGKD